jgi:protein involved in polysaccharide export with SLBB domain
MKSGATMGQAKMIFDGEYPLAAGDVLAINVANHPELSGSLPVTEAGKISLPTLGNLTVAGKTLAQAEKQITAVIATELTDPQVTVTLVSARPRQVLMVGNVKIPGPVDLHYNWRVSEAIDSAGGLTAESDDLIVTLARGKGQPRRLNLAKIMGSVESPENLVLKPGDILKFNLVPGRTVTVAGDVKTPATVVLRRDTRLLDALVGAGGLVQKPETSKITVVRAGHEIKIDAVQAYADRESVSNAPLLNGDLILVDAIRTNVSVVALHDEVRNSGNLSIPGQPRVLQAVLAADLTAQPDQVNISIRRGTEKIPVDLQKATYDPAYDIPLKDGDVLLFTPLDGPAVRVAGSVTKPGELNLGKDATLLDAIFASGGLNTKPEEVKLSILRQSNGRQSVLNVDPVGLISLRDLGQNVRLTDGDLVMVNPIQTRTVFISGEVATPGSYQMSENDGLVELLLRAGGPAPFAALKQVQVIRQNNTTFTVDLSKATAPGATRLPIDLEAGDIVTVPRNTNQVLVMNAVNRPGYIPIPENGALTIGDALLAAGGARDRARLQEVGILRKDAAGKYETIIVPVNDLAKKNSNRTTLSIYTPLQSGDIVYVPEGKSAGPGVQGALGMLSSVGAIRSLFF